MGDNQLFSKSTSIQRVPDMVCESGAAVVSPQSPFVLVLLYVYQSLCHRCQPAPTPALPMYVPVLSASDSPVRF